MKTTGPKVGSTNRLKDSHQSFVMAYIAQGLVNATLAYSKAYPNASQSSCEAGGSRLLKSHKVRQAIDSHQTSEAAYIKRTRSQHRDKLAVIADRSLEQEQYATSLKAEEAIGRLDGLYEQDTGEGKASYTKTLNVFFQALKDEPRQPSVSVLGEGDQVIDIEADTD